MQTFTKVSEKGETINTYRISVRLNEQEKTAFYAFANRAGLAEKSDTAIFKQLLQGSKKYAVTPPVTEEQLAVWRAFIAVGNNVNQIAKALNYMKKVHASGDKKVLKGLSKEFDKLSGIVKKLAVF